MSKGGGTKSIGDDGKNGKKDTLKNIEKAGFEALTIEQREMLISLAEGSKIVDAYKISHPKSKANKGSTYELASRERKIIYEKMGGIKNVMRAMGLGEERIMKVIHDALTAEKVVLRGSKLVELPDHLNRLRAVRELKDIFGLKEATLRLEAEVVVHEGAPDFVGFRQKMISRIMGDNGDAPLAITDEREDADSD